jgi:hypothetical protein
LVNDFLGFTNGGWWRSVHTPRRKLKLDDVGGGVRGSQARGGDAEASTYDEEDDMRLSSVRGGR